MKISRMKALVLGSVAVVVAGVAVGIAYLAFWDTKELRYRSQNALRNGIARVGGEELAHRGVSLDSTLNCADSPGWTKRKMRVTCTSSTSDHRQVQIIGAGEDATQDQYYTILVDGRPLVQNATCLGADCRKKS
ncbi:hypothetical protein [Actinomadura harenae]|uniref:DUF4333 domain-containing protein n=1 Tax=Actinomadura harenae TaxID=2483351 RepID=A0A3M2LLZ2_9ACTN|nr:hypothetical protein [Actinomadura harenae]RMI38454.1 hypothetical protein EBO15_32765 [Actinomadura harenae]